MAEQPSAVDVLEWAIPKWSPNIVLPESWVNETEPPEDRGPFHIIHCGNPGTALHVCELLNEEIERVIRLDRPDGD